MQGITTGNRWYWTTSIIPVVGCMNSLTWYDLIFFIACSLACLACNGPGIDHCTQCPDQTVLMNGYCLANCTAGSFNQAGQCLSEFLLLLDLKCIFFILLRFHKFSMFSDDYWTTQFVSICDAVHWVSLNFHWCEQDCVLILINL